jgi:hypothetical protein
MGLNPMKHTENTVVAKVEHVNQKYNFKNSVQPAGTNGDV